MEQKLNHPWGLPSESNRSLRGLLLQPIIIFQPCLISHLSQNVLDGCFGLQFVLMVCESRGMHATP